jgi:predicted GH43/DUF377 family glycosyl hydrolase
MSYALFFIVTLIALFITGLFFWGLWQVIRSATIKAKKYEVAKKELSLERHENNPILSPGKYEFEQEAVMNPAAVHDGERTHLFYRAIGNDGVSRVGYASSEDGIHFDDRLPYPVYSLEGPDPHLAALRRSYAEKNYPALVASGGSWGGVEDPRAVIIDGRVYLSFSAFQNWNSVRIGMISIALEDLKNKIWNWSPLTFLSPGNQVQKNWMLFPEKIKGQFALLHSISPKVEVAYRDDLTQIGKAEPLITSAERARVDIVDSRSGFWHSRMRGAGAPPLKTPFGWLLFYHAMQASESHKYKMGAMLLDSKDPSKVIARAPVPVLEPGAYYENNGIKPGIVYACGATAHNDDLTVYYGAADNFVCAARTSLGGFVDNLRKHQTGSLTPAPATFSFVTA